MRGGSCTCKLLYVTRNNKSWGSGEHLSLRLKRYASVVSDTTCRGTKGIRLMLSVASQHFADRKPASSHSHTELQPQINIEVEKGPLQDNYPRQGS